MSPRRFTRTAVVLLKAAVLIPVAVYLYDGSSSHAVPVRTTKGAWLVAFAVWVLATTPTRLFQRFIVARGPALWFEYVVNLHRLGVDERKYLPEPPDLSEYHALWTSAWRNDPNGAGGKRNIYKEKFDAYFGSGMSSAVSGTRSEVGRSTTIGAATLAPVIVAASVFSSGWVAAILVLDSAGGSASVAAMTAYGFMGAYVFSLQLLVRRYYQLDLRPSAYTSATVRILTAAVLAPVLYELSHEPTVAFVAGAFPLAALESLRSNAFRVLGLGNDKFSEPYPLTALQGVDLWYEERLREEGIENMQGLVTAPVADLLLHTRVPGQRLVDWLDQAILLLRLEPHPVKDKPDAATAARMWEVCRNRGIHKATDLLVAFGVYRPVDCRATGAAACPAAPSERLDEVRRTCWEPDGEAVALARALADDSGWSPVEVITLVRVIANDTTLAPVLNWREWGSQIQAEVAYRGMVSQHRPAA